MAVGGLALGSTSHAATEAYGFQHYAGESVAASAVDGPAAQARFRGATALVADPLGTLYFADSGNHTVRKLDGSGEVSTLAGVPGVPGNVDGPIGTSLVASPRAIAVDLDGSLYMATSSSLKKITADGTTTTIPYPTGATQTTSDLVVGPDGTLYVIGYSIIYKVVDGNAVELARGFAMIFAAAAAPDGSLIIADSSALVVYRVTSDGQVIPLAGKLYEWGESDGPGEVARFSWINDLTVDSAGNAYVLEGGMNRIRKITPAGQVTTLVPTGVGVSMYAIAASPDGTLYVGSDRTIWKVTALGELAFVAGDASAWGFVPGGRLDARFETLRQVATDAAGNVFVCSWSGVLRISAAGQVTQIAPRRDYEAIAVAPSGDLILGRVGVIERIDLGGNVSLVAGGGGSGHVDGVGAAARFAIPRAIAVDRNGVIYVADAGDYTIRRIAEDNSVTTLAGLPYTQGAVDGAGAEAQFMGPAGIAVNASGELFVSDGYNYPDSGHTIRKITPAGVVSTFAGRPAADWQMLDGQGANARFHSPGALSIDRSGDLFVLDGGDAVRKITPDGSVLTVAGHSGFIGGRSDGIGSRVMFGNPTGLAAGPDGQLWVVDQARDALVRGRSAGSGGLAARAAEVSREALATAVDELFSLAPFTGSPASLSVNSQGHLYFECPLPAGFTPPSLSAVGGSPFTPLAQLEKIHTRSSAPFAVYLDFDGETVTGKAWNDVPGAPASFECLPFDRDGDLTTLCYADSSFIWGVVLQAGQMLAPFDVDVTTEKPADPRRAIHIIVTQSRDAQGAAHPGSSGAGASFFGKLGTAEYEPAFVYADQLGSSRNVATAVAHMVGHRAGLVHSGGPAGECYAGHGDLSSYFWAPIMGAPYTAPYVQWTKGEYTGASSTQDQFATLAAAFGTVPDDFGAESSPSPLPSLGTHVSESGMISTPDDVDAFRFTTTTGGAITFQATDLTFGSLLTLKNSGGTVVIGGRSNFSMIGPADTYTLVIRRAGRGNPLGTPPFGWTQYGDLGGYSLEGTVTGLASQAPTASDPLPVLVARTGQTTGLSITPKGNPQPSMQWQRRQAGSDEWENLVDGRSFTGTQEKWLRINEPVYAMSGDRFRCVLSNSAGTATTAESLLQVSGAPGFTSRPLSRTVTVGDLVEFTAGTSSPDAVTYEWSHNGVPIPGATAASISLGSADLADNGYYQVTATNSEGTTRSYFQLHVVPAKLAIVAWGGEGGGQSPAVPAGLGSVLQLAAGSTHVLALKPDGTVAGWGAAPTATIPNGLDHVARLATSSQIALALKDDGSVVSWGYSPYPPVSTLWDVVDVDAGEYAVIALRANGLVAPNLLDNSAPQPGDVVAVAAGSYFYLTLDSRGQVRAFGNNVVGETTVPPGLANVTAIAAGGNWSGGHALALKSDGTVVAWGQNNAGQCDVPSGLRDVVSIAAGSNYSLALKTDGTIVAWGSNTRGQLNVPSEAAHPSAIEAGYEFALAMIPAVAPTLTSFPARRTVNVGASTTFEVFAAGTGPLAYQWYRDAVPLADGDGVTGATTAVLRISAAAPAHAGNYAVTVSNAGGVATTPNAELRIAAPSEFTARPSTQAVAPGGDVSFSVDMASGGPFTYEWRHNRTRLLDATTGTLSLTSVRPTDAGFYEAIVTNADGGVSRSVFYLTVTIPDATLAEWGQYAPATTPAYRGAVRAIDQGGASVLVKGDGTVMWWGAPQSYSWPMVVPADLSDVVAVACGSSTAYGTHAIALKADGTVVGWGSNAYGEALTPAGLGEVVAIASGRQYNLALKADGTVVGWGRTDYETAVPAGLRDVVAIAAGDRIALALKSDGTVVAWGGLTSNVPPDAATDVVGIAAGSGSALAVRADGTVIAWGDANRGSAYVPTGLTDVSTVETDHNGDTGFAMGADGSLTFWGTQLFAPPTGLVDVLDVAAGRWALAVTVPRAPTIDVQPVALSKAVGDYIEFEVSASGSLPLSYQWRQDGVALNDGPGIAGTHSAVLRINRAAAADAGAYDVVASNIVGSTASDAVGLSVAVPPTFTLRPLSCVTPAGTPASFTCAVADPAGVSYEWRRNGQTIDGATAATLAIPNVASGDDGYYEVIASNGTAAARSTFHVTVSSVSATNYTVAASGDSGYGAQGASSVPRLEHVVRVAAGKNHGLALLADGTVRAWGPGFFGTTLVPGDLPQVVGIAGGEYNSLALLATGDVVSWGHYFELPPPVPADLRHVVAIAARGSTNLALKSDGTVAAWGIGAPPSGLSGVRSIAAGERHALALKSDGTVVAWGANGFGQASVPSGLSSVIAVAAGDNHSLALKADGTVVAWGDNASGQCALPTNLSGVVAIAGGTAHSLALRNDHSLVAWGRNSSGQSNGIDSFMGIQGMAGSGLFNLLLIPIIPPAITRQPNSAVVTAGHTVTFDVATTGTAPQYRWRKDGVPLVDGVGLSGTASATLRIVNARPESAGSYDVEVSNEEGSVLSQTAQLTVRMPPSFTQRPSARAVTTGATITLDASATGVGQLTYVWRHNGRVLAGQTGPTLTLASVSRQNAGSYSVTVSDALNTSNDLVTWLYVRDLADSELQVVQWGSGLTTLPSNLTNVVTIEAGGSSSIALKADGSLVAWGPLGNTYPLPSGLGNVVAVAISETKGVALRADGTVRSFGSSVSDSSVTESLFGVIAVASTEYQAFALLQDGRVVCWSYVNPTAPAFLPGFTTVTRIAAEAGRVVALKQDGTVLVCSDGNTTSYTTSPEAVDVSAGVNFTIAAKKDGSVMVWGYDAETIPEAARGIVEVSAGRRHATALRADGTLVSWCSLNAGPAPTVPPEYALRIVSVAAGNTHDVALVTSVPGAPEFSLQPGDARLAVGGRADFEVSVRGGEPIALQWQYSENSGTTWANVVESESRHGANARRLEIGPVSAQDHGLKFRCLATNRVAQGVASTVAGLNVVATVSDDLDGDLFPDIVWQNRVTGQRVLWLLDGTRQKGSFVDLGSLPVQWRIAAKADFNGDGTNDLVLENRLTGERGFWLMNGTTRQGNLVPLITVDPEWTIAGAGDFNGDGEADLVVQNTRTGVRGFWLMQGTAISGNFVPLYTVGVDWNIAGVGDYNGDQKPDLVLENTATGQRGFWLLNGTSIAGNFVSLAMLSTDWRIAGSADYNGDGQTDIAWQNATTGRRGFWLMNGTTLNSEFVDLTVLPTEWSMNEAAWPERVVCTRDDLDGDGKPDVTWQNEVTGQRVLWALDGLRQKGSYVDLGTLPVQWRMAAMADFNGDGRNDLVLEDRATGERGFWLMNGTARQGNLVPLITVDPEWTIAGAGDFNGDGQADLVLQNARTGVRGFWLMQGTAIRGNFVPLYTVGVDWSIVGVGDYNGDGKSDLVLENTVTGERGFWLLNGTSIAGNFVSLGIVSTDWRIAGSADYNGDGQADIAWQNATTGRRGFWLMRGTSLNSEFVDLTVLPSEWSMNGADWPSPVVCVPDDLDGDGRPDVVWQNEVTGQRVLWLLDGTRQKGSYVDLGTMPVQWRIAALGDFDGDGRNDLVWENQATGERGFWLMNGTARQGNLVPLITVEPEWTIAGAGDFNGDGHNDLVLQNTRTGVRGFWLMKRTAINGNFVPLYTVSVDWSIAGVGDYNGDRKPDLVLENTGTGQRGFWLLNGTAIAGDFIALGAVTTDWRIAGSADYNGDGEADIAWQNTTTGRRGFWLMSRTSLNSDFVDLTVLSAEWTFHTARQ